MKRKIILFFIHTILCFVLCSCDHSKKIASEQAEGSFILGSGGGFTGAYETYRIHKNGKIEKQNADFENYSFLNEIPSDSAKACFKTLDAMALEGHIFDQPGNMTYFIELEGNTIKWGRSGHTIRADIENFFERTRKMIRAEYP